MKNKNLLKAIVATMTLIALNTTNANAQGMAINTSGAAAHSSAALDVTSTTQGVLVPRMTASQRTGISSPATGLLVYQTDGTAGFYYYNGSSWTSLSTPSGAAGGDLTGTYPNPTLATSGVAAGSYGTASAVSSVTVDSKGRVTSASNTSIAISGSQITSGTVGTARLGSGSASSSTYLRGDGTWATPSGGGSSITLDLVATKTTSQTISNSTNTGITFNSTITSPSIGSFNGTTYTVGASGSYLIMVNVCGTPISTLIGFAIPSVLVNGTVAIAGAASGNASTALPSPSGRGAVSQVLSLASGDAVTVQATNPNTTWSFGVSTDGTTRISIIKL